ncbi:MAG: nuclear transport factor 2 family protein [Candidatus Odinarchaeota archaeon]
MDRETSIKFCSEWLAAWTGNEPELLTEFYSENAYYQDPANPEGLKGQEQMLPYFRKLLAGNPDWEWKAVEIFPTEKGFAFKWRATIPIGQETITEYGLDIVEINNGKITRNEVYFDRSKLLTRLKTLKKGKSEHLDH